MKNTVEVATQHGQITIQTVRANLASSHVLSKVPSHLPCPVDQQLLSALSSGASNKHIALMLFKSEFTVRNRLSRVYKKIHVTNRAQAAVWYRDFVTQMPQVQLDAQGQPRMNRQPIATPFNPLQTR